MASAVKLNRWTKHGHDRLYVNYRGVARGFVDLRTGNPRPKDGLAWQEEISVEVGRWLRHNGFQADRWPTDVRTPAPANSPERRPRAAAGRSSAREPGRDLAKNRPGQAVAAEARRRRTIWTRLGRLLGMRTRDGSWRVGAHGEQLVGRTLWWLRPLGWRSLHAVPIGDRGADIDHLVIGPGGVYTINTKYHPGAEIAVRREIYVRGVPTDYAYNARIEAGRAGLKLRAALGSHLGGHRIEVQPLIVTVGAKIVGRRWCDGVRVVRRERLRRFLLLQRPRLGRRARAELYKVARRESTWT